MGRQVLESARLILKPLSFNELSNINKNEMENIESIIELEAISDLVKLAILKKLKKMKNVSKDIHEWYTYWLIINKDNQKGIGFIGFKGFPIEDGYSEVGYSISPNYRNQRLMTEALETLVKWAYEFRECKGVIARGLKTNIGSNKVLSNCNFKVNNSIDGENNYILKYR